MVTTSPLAQHADDALRRDALFAIARTALVLAGLAALATVAATPAGLLGPWFVPKALALYGCGTLLMWQGLPAHAPHRRFGAANSVTLLRLALMALLAAGADEPGMRTETLAWGAVVLATVTALLDAADGPLARRQRLGSEFGARFDMETDAAMVLVLSALVLLLDKAGPWVLASGGLRYAFVLAAGLWPWLAAPLPPSQRRKTICVVQIVVLIVCLGPIVTPPWAELLAAAGLALLVYSFAADIGWLARRRRARRIG